MKNVIENITILFLKGKWSEMVNDSTFELLYITLNPF